MKPFYRKKRYWALTVAVLLVYFCLIPSPLRISPETTCITEPLLPDGTPDYFAAWSQATWQPNLSPPENNGARLMLAACGPRILEQNAMLDEVPWDEFPTHKKSKSYFESYWKPLCEAMGIDPLAKPEFLNKRAYTDFINRKQKTLKGTPEEKDWTHEASDIRYKKTAWKTAEHPEIAAWMADYSPVLDLLGVAVRKPHYEGWRKRTENLIVVLLPDIQASREFARALQVRIAARIGDGNVDGAVYDLMTMYHLARHFLRADIFVTKLVGNAAEQLAYESSLLLIQSGKASREQLAQFAESLQKLPSRWDRAVVDGTIEHLMLYDTLNFICKQGLQKRRSITFDSFIPFLALLPLDMNTAGRRLTELLREDILPEWKISPAKWRAFADASEEKIQKIGKLCRGFQIRYLASPLIYVRSRMVAEHLYDHFCPAWQAFIQGVLDGGTKTELLRLALALELSYADSANTGSANTGSANAGGANAGGAKYPETLTALVPQYIDAVPLDPFTGQATLQYKPAQDGYLLYSYGQNGVDDGGAPMTKNDRNTGDIVIKRKR